MLKLQIIGHLGADVKVITTTEKPFIAFNVCEQGSQNIQQTWVECTMGFKHGELPAVAKYLTKGKTVFIEGRPYVKKYTPKDGDVAAAMGLFVERIELCGGSQAQ